MRVLFFGSREWDDWDPICRELKKFPQGTVIIHGDCRGADRIAGHFATEMGLEVVPFPADWDHLGKAAGPYRNQQMIDEGKPDFAIGFHHFLAGSSGSKDMVNRLEEAKIWYTVFER